MASSTLSYCGALKAITVAACLTCFIANTKYVFEDFISGATFTTSSLVVPPGGTLRLPTIVFCNYTGYKANTSMYISTQQYLERTLDPWEFIIGVSPNNTRTSNDVWEFQILYTLLRGQCIAIKYKPEVCEKSTE